MPKICQIWRELVVQPKRLLIVFKRTSVAALLKFFQRFPEKTVCFVILGVQTDYKLEDIQVLSVPAASVEFPRPRVKVVQQRVLRIAFQHTIREFRQALEASAFRKVINSFGSSQDVWQAGTAAQACVRKPRVRYTLMVLEVFTILAVDACVGQFSNHRMEVMPFFCLVGVQETSAFQMVKSFFTIHNLIQDITVNIRNVHSVERAEPQEMSVSLAQNFVIEIVEKLALQFLRILGFMASKNIDWRR